MREWLLCLPQCIYSHKVRWLKDEHPSDTPANVFQSLIGIAHFLGLNEVSSYFYIKYELT